MILNQDLIIKGGYVVDGSGKIPFKADLKIENGLISDIGKQRFNTDQRIIDATNLFVAPGFIDAHSHSDLMFLSSDYALMECKIRQGVTTEIIGQDGIGVAPVNERSISKVQELVKGIIGDSNIPKDWRWNDISSYVEIVREHKIPNNFAILIPHGTVRVVVKGMNSGPAAGQELEDMKNIKKENTKGKILHPIVSAFFIIFFTIYGYMLSGALHTASIRSHYPYYGMLVLPAVITSRAKKYILGTIVFSVIAFFISFFLSMLIFFSAMPAYGVYER